MSTRGRLGIQLSDDSILSIYNHFDSYPEFLGVKLQEHFNSYDAAVELIDGGDISCIWTNLGFNNETLPTIGPLPYSSRGDEVPPAKHDDLYDFLTYTDQCDGEYAYLFVNDEWICYKPINYKMISKSPEQISIPAPAVTV